MTTSQMSLFDLFEDTAIPLPVHGVNEVDSFETSKRTKDGVDELFSTNQEVNINDLFENLSAETSENNQPEVADVRSQKQKNNKVSYDVGERIFGARKDLAALKELFLQKADSSVLEEIAELDAVVADDLANKANVFGWFSMEDCSNRGVDIYAAYAMSLLIRRIPTNSKGLNRAEYMTALIFISDCLKTVTTFKEFNIIFHRFQTLVPNEREKEYRERQFKSIIDNLDYLKKENSKDLEEFKRLHDRAYLTNGLLYIFEVKQAIKLEQLGSFSELLQSYKKIKTFEKSLNKYKDWQQYFDANGNKAATNAEVERKPVWERELPVEPKREGGREIDDFKSPEEFKLYFGFKGVQFGNWVGDDYALAHLVNSGRAFVDLADILKLDVQHVSLGNELSMAFGARGKGRALGHYERGYHIINLTKEKGSLGILAHEWFHGYDHFLSMKLSNQNGYLLTEGEHVDSLPSKVYEKFVNLLITIKKGKSTAYVDVGGFKGTYKMNKAFVDLYHEVEGDLQEFMDTRLARFDKRVSDSLRGIVSDDYYQKMKAKYERKRKTELRQNAEALSQLHFEITGDRVSKIPYTTNETKFYRNAIELDRGKKGKYWSSNHELCARVFEAYIDHELKARGWRSDYLVYGIDTIAYPALDERNPIFEAMKEFLQVTLPYLYVVK